MASRAYRYVLGRYLIAPLQSRVQECIAHGFTDNPISLSFMRTGLADDLPLRVVTLLQVLELVESIRIRTSRTAVSCRISSAPYVGRVAYRALGRRTERLDTSCVSAVAFGPEAWSF